MAETSSDPLEARIAAHLRRLCVDIGPRPGGTPANHAAAEYIRGVLCASGMGVAMEEFACPAWEERETRLEVNGAPLTAAANAFSPPCDVAGPAMALGTLAQLEAAELSGRVGILYGDLAANTLSAKSWFLKSEHDDRSIRLLEGKAPAALITVQPRLGELERIIEDWELLIPSATVAARDGLALLREPDPSVRLRIDSRREPGRTWNVIGRKAGSRAASRGRVILCAHYDTKFDTPGALDNGGGVAIVLALAEHLGGLDLPLDLECIAFGNEDTGLPTGSLLHVDKHQGELGEIVALLNFDGAGHALVINTVMMVTHSDAFRAAVEGVQSEYPGIIWTDPWPQSDHSAFAWRGVPCLAFSSPAMSYLAHLRCDSVEWASPAKLAEVASFAAQVVQSLQDRDPAWTREPVG
jgi:aminopeptidase YwaD